MRVDRFSLPLADPLGTARGTITEREGFVVRLNLDGTTGVGEAAPLPGWTESLADCEAALERVATEIGHTALETILDGLDGAPAARHAVASAALDARTRAGGEPLHRRLERECGSGEPSEPVESVPVNATVGDGTPAETVTAAADAVAAGFGTVKLKVGGRPVTEEMERIAAVRERCPAVTLRADANGAWDHEEAERALDTLAEHGVDYVEQPLPADATRAPDGGRHDFTAHAALRGGAVGIALDESLAAGDGADADDPVREALDAGAADVVVLKPMALGGPDRARAAAAAARRADVMPVVTTTIDGALARATAVHVAASIPDVSACGLATRGRLARDLLDRDPSPVARGAARVPDGPGVVGTTRWHGEGGA